MKLGHLSLLPLLAGGCRLDAAGFYEQYSAQLCKTLESCQEPYFDALYPAGRDACVEHNIELFEQEAPPDCAFDEAAGQACVKALRQADCEAFAQGRWALSCDELYACGVEE